MSTIGELSDLDVADLIDIFTRRERTGRLIVKTGGLEVQLFFEEGRISLVSSSDMTIRLGRMLIRQGLLDTPRLLEALHAQAEDEHRRPLGVILVERGWITREDLIRCVEEQSIEALARAITNEPGLFVFDPGVTKPANVEAIPLEPHLLLKAARERTEALRVLQEQLPRQDTLLSLAPHHSDLDRNHSDLGASESMIATVLRSGPKNFGELGVHVALDELSIGVAVLTLLERGVVTAHTGSSHSRNSGRESAA